MLVYLDRNIVDRCVGLELKQLIIWLMNFSRQNCYVFACHPCTPPELKIIQVKHKDQSLSCFELHTL